MAFYPTVEYHSFQNSKVGRVDLDISRNSAILKFTPVFKPVSPKDITKGMKVYNYEQTQNFALSTEECVVLSPLFELQKSNQLPEGTIHGTISCSKNGIFVTHYPQNGVSTLIISKLEDQGSGPKYYLGYTLKQGNQEVAKLGMALDQFQFKIFKIFIESYPQARLNMISTMKALQEYDREINSTNNNNSTNRTYNTPKPSQSTQQAAPQVEPTKPSEPNIQGATSLSQLV